MNGIDEANVRAELAAIVLRASKLRLTEVHDSQRLNYELGFDSHGLLNLLLDVEDHFGIEVPPERVPEILGAPFGVLVQEVSTALASRAARQEIQG